MWGKTDRFRVPSCPSWLDSPRLRGDKTRYFFLDILKIKDIYLIYHIILQKIRLNSLKSIFYL